MARQQQPEESLLPERELYHLIKSDGWKVAKDIINDKIAVIKDVTNIPADLSNEQLARETSGRIYTVALIEEWFAEIQARVDNFIATTEQPDEETDHIVRQ